MSWKTHVINVEASHDVDLISETIDECFKEMFEVGKLDFTHLPAEVNSLHLAAALRVSKSRSIGWEYARDVAIKACLRDNYPIEDVLSGLL